MPKRGFTLVELAVTISVLAVVIAIALPNFSRVWMASNERSVIEGIRSVVLALENYQVNTNAGFPNNLSQLTGARPPYLDGRFTAIHTGGNLWKGYRWTYEFQPGFIAIGTQGGGTLSYPSLSYYILRADPVQRGLTGQRSFFVDQTGTIRFNLRQRATANDTPLEQAEK